MNLLKAPLMAGLFFLRAVGDAMNPRQMRGDEFQGRFGLFAPQPLVEGGARDRFVDGDDDLELFVVLTNDTRCGACGLLLFSVVREGAYVHVAIGLLVDAPSIRPTEHIFIDSKAPGSRSRTTCLSSRS
jgi:hypothetical protein